MNSRIILAINFATAESFDILTIISSFYSLGDVSDSQGICTSRNSKSAETEGAAIKHFTGSHSRPATLPVLSTLKTEMIYLLLGGTIRIRVLK